MTAASSDPDVLSWFLAGYSISMFLAEGGAIIAVFDCSQM